MLLVACPARQQQQKTSGYADDIANADAKAVLGERDDDIDTIIFSDVLKTSGYTDDIENADASAVLGE